MISDENENHPKIKQYNATKLLNAVKTVLKSKSWPYNCFTEISAVFDIYRAFWKICKASALNVFKHYVL